MEKVRYTCGIPTMASCVTTQVTPNAQSSLTGESCFSQEEQNEDVYEQLGDIRTETDLSALGDKCLSYVKVGGKLFVKNALLKMEEEICALKTEVANLKDRPLCDQLLGDCIDTKCLVDACANPVKTWGQLVQILIDRECTP